MLRRIGCALVVLASLALVAVIVLWRMSRMAPAWYAPPQAHSLAVATLADDFEYGIVEQAQQQRAVEQSEWSTVIEETQINAWLVNRLPKWIAHDSSLHWPSSIGAPQVRIERQGVSIAVPIGENAPRVVVVRILPVMQEGRIRLQVGSVSVGRITMPGEPLKNLIKTIEDVSPETLSDPGLQQAIAILSGQEPIDPVIELQDGRRVRLTSLRLLDRKIELRAITENQ